MKRIERINLYKKLCCHSKFDLLSEKLQEVLSYLAAGYSDTELSVMYNVSHGTPWSYRESILKVFGYKVYEPNRRNSHTQGPTRAMTLEELRGKIKEDTSKV